MGHNEYQQRDTANDYKYFFHFLLKKTNKPGLNDPGCGRKRALIRKLQTLQLHNRSSDIRIFFRAQQILDFVFVLLPVVFSGFQLI